MKLVVRNTFVDAVADRCIDYEEDPDVCLFRSASEGNPLATGVTGPMTFQLPHLEPGSRCPENVNAVIEKQAQSLEDSDLLESDELTMWPATPFSSPAHSPRQPLDTSDSTTSVPARGWPADVVLPKYLPAVCKGYVEQFHRPSARSSRSTSIESSLHNSEDDSMVNGPSPCQQQQSLAREQQDSSPYATKGMPSEAVPPMFLCVAPLLNAMAFPSVSPASYMARAPMNGPPGNFQYSPLASAVVDTTPAGIQAGMANVLAPVDSEHGGELGPGQASPFARGLWLEKRPAAFPLSEEPSQKLHLAKASPQGRWKASLQEARKQILRRDDGDFVEQVPWKPRDADSLAEFLGQAHRFHNETESMGSLSADGRQFTKTGFEGRLSLATENQIHSGGVHRYLMQFTHGEMSSADGLGFVFSPSLPCPKNIQQITSVFVNKGGRICMRARKDVRRSDVVVKRLELGDWIGMEVDLDEEVARFIVWPRDGSKSTSASMAFGEGLPKDRVRKTLSRPATGYFACLIKNTGVMVTLAS
jgi:hypothetical protein